MLSRRWLLAAGLAPTPALLSGPAEAAASAGAGVFVAANRDELAQARPAPSIQGVILAGFHGPGDGGGAQYRRVNAEPGHPGKIRSADGVWWELCEHRPTPEMFGADGTYDGDTAGLQACCDYVRANYVFGEHSGQHEENATDSSTGAVYLNARTYRLNRSIDFTDRGDKIGLAMVGGGKFSTILTGRLSEPYPIIDMSGVSNARLIDLTISDEDGDQSSCCLLLANVVGTNQHNNVPVIDRCLFVGDYSPNMVTALIIQGCDLAVVQNSGAVSSHAPACSYGTGVPALYHGYAIAAGSTASTIQLNVSGVYDNDPAGLGGSVVGKLVSFNAGTAARDWPVRTIAGYDASTHKITLDAPLAVAPDNTTRLAILAVKSKYRTLSNLPDNTSALFIGSNFSGTTGFHLRSQCSFTAIGCYFTAINAGSGGVVIMDDYLFSDTEHVVRFIGGCRWEDASRQRNFSGFLTYNQIALLDIEGEMSLNTAVGAQIGTARGGTIHNLRYVGDADNGTPLFHIVDASGRPAGITNVEGLAKWIPLGVVSKVGTWRLENISSVGGMAQTIASIAGSGTYQGVPILGRQGALLNGVAATLSSVLELQSFDAARARTTGGASQKRLSWTVPARALAISNATIRPRLHAEFAGSCNAAMPGFGVRLAQTAPANLSSTLETGALTAGAVWRLTLDVMRLGVGWVWSGALWNGATLAHSFQGGLPMFSEANDLQIELFENAATANAVDVTTCFGQLS